MKAILLTALTLGIALSSCNKYEDGPSISLRSRAARVAGDWKVKKATSDGQDITSILTGFNYSINYTKDGNYTATMTFMGTTDTEKGTWEFYDNDTKMISTDAAGLKDTMAITMLKNAEMHLKSLDGKDELQLEAK